MTEFFNLSNGVHCINQTSSVWLQRQFSLSVHFVDYFNVAVERLVTTTAGLQGPICHIILLIKPQLPNGASFFFN